MQPAEYNITHTQGDTFDKNYTITQGGSSLNLTGYTGLMQIRSTADSSTVVAEFTTSDSSMVLGNGTIRLTLAKTVWSSIAPKTYVHDLELTSPSGTRLTYWAGTFTLEPEVSRA